jgi:PIN domain nuclease of toxin-antitoxin system
MPRFLLDTCSFLWLVAEPERLPPESRALLDRMLVAQAEHETLTLVSPDDVFDRYGAARLWR